MLVDNAIVIGEKYVHIRQKNIPPIKAANEAVHEMFKPVLATTVTTILAFLPMLFIKGIMGEWIKWIPIVVSIALAISLIEAFFYCLVDYGLLLH